MSNLATYLQIGDFVDLQDDSIFDPACEIGCIFRTQNAVLVEIESDGDQILMTFATEHDRFTASVPLDHQFNDPE